MLVPVRSSGFKRDPEAVGDVDPEGSAVEAGDAVAGGPGLDPHVHHEVGCGAGIVHDRGAGTPGQVRTRDTPPGVRYRSSSA